MLIYERTRKGHIRHEAMVEAFHFQSKVEEVPCKMPNICMFSIMQNTGRKV